MKYDFNEQIGHITLKTEDIQAYWRLRSCGNFANKEKTQSVMPRGKQDHFCNTKIQG